MIKTKHITRLYIKKVLLIVSIEGRVRKIHFVLTPH